MGGRDLRINSWADLVTWVDGWMDGWLVGWLGGWVVKWVVKWVDVGGQHIRMSWKTAGEDRVITGYRHFARARSVAVRQIGKDVPS